MKSPRLFGKMLLAVFVLFVVTDVATTVYTSRVLSEELTRESTSKGAALAESTSRNCVFALLYQDPATIQSLLDNSLEIDGVAYLFVIDQNGEIVGHTFVPGVPPEVRDIPGDERQTTSRTVTFRGK
jgi:sensor histidine kinase regulating citrate/malate metabolism